MTGRRVLLHVFSTFNVGGPQIRFAQLANYFGDRYSHRIVSMDGSTQAMARLQPGLDVELVEAEIHKGRTFKNICNFRRVLKRLRPDLLVTSNWGSIEWAMANFDHSVPHLHMEDGFGPEEAARQITRRVWTRRFVLSKSFVMLPSRVLYNLARDRWKLPAKNILFLPNGVDCTRFQAAPDLSLASQYGIRRDIPVIGAIGGLRAEKNLHRLLEAFAIVVRSRPAQLVLVGDGPSLSALKELVEHYDIRDDVIFTGASSVPERLLPLLSIFALSSDTEQMPLSILEAMAASRPVASTDVGDVREMLAEENRPYVVEASAERLAESIRGLLDNPDKAAEIGRANRSRVISQYDQSHMFAGYQKLFDGQLSL